MEESLIHIKNEAMSRIVEASNDEIEQIYIDYLGKKGKLTLVLKDIPKLSEDRRAEVGRLANEIKNSLEEQINDKRADIKRGANLHRRQQAQIDVTMPGQKPPVGSLHLVTQAIEEITSIFEKIGLDQLNDNSTRDKTANKHPSPKTIKCWLAKRGSDNSTDPSDTPIEKQHDRHRYSNKNTTK